MGANHRYRRRMPSAPEALNQAIRDLIEAVRTADLDLAAAGGVDLGQATTDLQTMTAGIRAHRVEAERMQAGLRPSDFAPTGGPEDFDEAARKGGLEPGDFFPYSPLVGRLNPISPPITLLRAENGEVRGEAVFRAPFNGPPGSVHGGILAAAFDELLGCVCVTNGIGGFTGTLTVIYRSTTPIEQPITMRGWHDRTEGRKVFAKGTMYHGDTLCAEAEGIFIRSADLPDPRAV